MKSNEEFIAGIYEKAALYTEEKETNVIRVNFAAKAVRVAAMVVLCLGLAGVGAMTLNHNNSRTPDKVPSPSEGNYGIALTSETDNNTEGSTAQLRVGPVSETVTFTGVVESVDAGENRIWIQLVFDEDAPLQAVGSVVCIRWDILEPISGELVNGVLLTATGALSEYTNETSEHNGCAELVLTDVTDLVIQ